MSYIIDFITQHSESGLASYAWMMSLALAERRTKEWCVSVEQDTIGLKTALKWIVSRRSSIRVPPQIEVRKADAEMETIANCFSNIYYI